MTEKQFKEASKLSYIISLIMLVYMELTIVTAAVMVSATATVIVQAVIILIAIICCGVGFFVFKGSTKGAFLIMISTTIAFFVSMILNRTSTTFLYAFIIMFAS